MGNGREMAPLLHIQRLIVIVLVLQLAPATPWAAVAVAAAVPVR